MERRPGEAGGGGVVGRARGRGRARNPVSNPVVGRGATENQPQLVKPGATEEPATTVSLPEVEKTTDLASGIGWGRGRSRIQQARKESNQNQLASSQVKSEATGINSGQIPVVAEEEPRANSPASVPGNERETVGGNSPRRGNGGTLPNTQLRPVKRPIQGGKSGKPILLRANFLKLVIKAANVLVWHYDVRVTSKKRNIEVKNKSALREVMDRWVATQVRAKDNQFYAAYDGRNSVYTNKPFPMETVTRFEVVLSDDREFCLALKAADSGVINLSEALDYFNVDGDYPAPYPARQIQAMDIIIRESALQNGYFSIGRLLFFDVLRESGRERGRPLNPYYELWNGAFQSVRPTWKCLMLQVDMVVRAFHKGQHMLDLQEQFEKEDYNRWANNMSRHIQGVKFTGHKFGYTAFGLGVPANKHSFEVDGKRMTVEEYYKFKNNITLKYPNLPCVQAKPKEKNCFIPMELCFIKSNQVLDNLSEALSSQLLDKQTMGASQRMLRIDDIIKKLKFSDNKVLKAFNIQIEAKMMDNIEGRVLDAPSMEYKNGTREVVDGRFSSRGAQLYNAIPIRTVLLYSLTMERDFLNKSKLLLKELSKAAQQMGLSLPSEAKEIKKLNDSWEIEKQLNTIKSYKYDLPLLAIFIMPNQRRNDFYDTIKTIGDSTLGIYTQCFKEKNAFDQRGIKPTTLSNLCLKINGKFGGINSWVKNTLEFFRFEKRVMIMGADVNHPGANRLKPSIAAVTASYDNYACRYKSRITVQEGGKETILALEKMTMELLDDYSRSNKGMYPEIIIYFRDGVSEGQFDKMLSFELLCLQRACARVAANYRPGITMVVVRKRHRTKFETMDGRKASGPGQNVPPGTVEDRATVDPHRFEYYLCSHYACKGTSKSGLYTVLYDDNGFTMDAMEQLSLRLCHLFARCSQAVSYPAPTYYADLCAERGRRYVECPGNNGIKDIIRIHNDINGMYFL